jgi:prephenate dehydrogenase
MILVAVPLNTYVGAFEKIKGKFKADAVITDVGSAKACVIEDAVKVFGNIPPNFVPGHPIAGTEKNGFEAAFAELYRKRRVVLTPTAETSAAAVNSVTAMWRATGAVVECTDAAHHDRVLATTSHLPHILAFGLVDSLAKAHNVEEIFRFAAGGFRDFTRIAASDPAVWRDICLRNRDALLQALELYGKDLNEMRNAIARGDEATLMEIFTRAKTARDKFSFN